MNPIVISCPKAKRPVVIEDSACSELKDCDGAINATMSEYFLECCGENPSNPEIEFSRLIKKGRCPYWNTRK